MIFRFVRTSSLTTGTERPATGNKPRHMRWRDKIKYLEKEQRRHSVDSASIDHKAVKASPVKDAADIPVKLDVVQSFNTEVTKNVDEPANIKNANEPAKLHTTPAPRPPSSKRHKSYSQTFVRHPPHMRFRDKMAILSGKKSANFAVHEPVTVASEE